LLCGCSGVINRCLKFCCFTNAANSVEMNAGPLSDFISV